MRCISARGIITTRVISAIAIATAITITIGFTLIRALFLLFIPRVLRTLSLSVSISLVDTISIIYILIRVLIRVLISIIIRVAFSLSLISGLALRLKYRTNNSFVGIRLT